MPRKGTGYGRDLPEGFSEFREDGLRRCWARAKSRGGDQCPNRAMKGQKVCRMHGGAAKHSVQKGKQRVAEAEVEEATRRALAVLDVAPVDNPLTALSEVAGQILAWKDQLSYRVNVLSQIRYEDDKGAEQLRAEVALYERAMDRSVNVLATIGRLNIDERLAAINEKQAEKLIALVDALLEHLGIAGEQAVEARRFLARKLRSA